MVRMMVVAMELVIMVAVGSKSHFDNRADGYDNGDVISNCVVEDKKEEENGEGYDYDEW